MRQHVLAKGDHFTAQLKSLNSIYLYTIPWVRKVVLNCCKMLRMRALLWCSKLKNDFLLQVINFQKYMHDDYFMITVSCNLTAFTNRLLLIYRKGPGAIYTPNQPTDETDGASVEVIDHRSKEFETSHITDLIISSPPPSSNALYYGSTTTPVDYSETLSGTYLAKRSNKA